MIGECAGEGREAGGVLRALTAVAPELIIVVSICAPIDADGIEALGWEWRNIYHADAFYGAGTGRVRRVVGIPGDFACEFGPCGFPGDAFEAGDASFLPAWSQASAATGARSPGTRCWA